VFEVVAGSGAITTLASFNGTDGANSQAGLVMDGRGDLFGTTVNGGAWGYGTVFEVAAGSGAITTLASFNSTNGTKPPGGLVLDGRGDLFGTTSEGGAWGYGTVFEVAAGSGAITTLASFNSTNGANPPAGLVMDGSGDLFGTTAYGGAWGAGTVFEVAAGSGAITTLASFNGTDGAVPFAGLVLDGSGNLFGTTLGTVFEVAAGSGAITTLASFNHTNGAFPIYAGLVLDGSGNLFGTTSEGGAWGYGTVFEVVAGNPAPTSVSVTAGPTTYNGEPYAGASAQVEPATDHGALTFTYYNTTDAELKSPLSGAPVNAGDYLVVANVAAAPGYDAAVSAAVKFTITPRDVLAAFNADDKVYDGNTLATTSLRHVAGVIGDDQVSLMGDATFASPNVVDTPIAVTMPNPSLTGPDASNYHLTFVVTTWANITPAPLAIKADAQSKVYGDADPALTCSITSGQLFGTDALSGALSRAPGENAGTYAITQGTLAAGSNYVLTFAPANLTITPRTIGGHAVTQAALNIAKMGTLDFTITTDQLVNGDTMAALNGAQFTLTIGATVYSIKSTAVASADGKMLYVSWRMSAELKTALEKYSGGATSASTARTVKLTVSASTQNYDFSADFTTKLFNSAK
jgi:uncharacterized repeat protein (TIGR03803 family)